MGWFSKKRMVGGMAFGPPGWMPERIEETFDAASSGVEGAFARGSTGDPAPLARGSTGDPEGISKASVSVPAASAEDSQGSRGDTAGLARGSGGHAAAMTGASGGDAAATAGSSREAEAGVARGSTPVAAGSGRAADGTRSVPATVVLTDRHSLLETLARMKLARASAMIPGLAEQVESLAGKGVRAMVLVLLPTQPEYVLGPALSKLAMEEMAAGMEALKKALRPGGVYIVMDRHELWLRNLWKGPAAALGARRVGLMNEYPVAHPTVTMKRVFGEKLAAGAMPTAREMVFVDPVSCWAIGRHVRTGQGFTDRPIQIFTEHAPARLVMGRVGESVGEMMGRYRVVERRKAGETRGDKGMGKGTGSGSGSGNGAEVQVILNGMMLGQEGREGDLVTGMTEAVSVREAVGNEWPTPCIACGWCVDVCPTALTPVHLMQLNHRPSAATLRTKDAQEARHCIGCGLCSYVCPTRLPLMEQVVSLRRKVGG